MYHIPISVECIECNIKSGKVSSRLCEALAKYLAWKNCSLNSSKRLKRTSENQASYHKIEAKKLASPADVTSALGSRSPIARP